MADNVKNYREEDLKDFSFLENNSNKSFENEKFHFVIQILNGEFKIKDDKGNEIVLNSGENQQLYNNLDGIIKKFSKKIKPNKQTTIYIKLNKNNEIIKCEIQSGSEKREIIKLKDKTRNELQKFLCDTKQKFNEKIIQTTPINQVVKAANVEQPLPSEEKSQKPVTNTNS